MQLVNIMFKTLPNIFSAMSKICCIFALSKILNHYYNRLNFNEI